MEFLLWTRIGLDKGYTGEQCGGGGEDRAQCGGAGNIVRHSGGKKYHEDSMKGGVINIVR